MVRFFLLISQLFFLSFTVASDLPQLTINTNKTQLEMGKYLTVKIKYTGYEIPDNSDLEHWYEDFYIERGETESENLSANIIQTTQKLRLYPRSSGAKVLHALVLGGALARPVTIKVLPVIRDGIDGTPYWQDLPQTIWQGQTIQLSIVQNLLHAANQVVVDKARFNGFDVLGPEQLHLTKIKNNKEYRQIKINWLLTPYNTGDLVLEPPAIVQRGRGRWRFYLSRLNIEVKPLPDYLPVTLAVGQVSIKTALFYQNNRPYWSLELYNTGLLPDEVYGIRKQLAQIAGIQPEAVYFSDTQAGQDGSKGFTHRYEIPVPAWTLAVLPAPELTMQYFNVVQGHISSLSQTFPSVSYITQSWRYTLFFIMALLLLLLFAGLLKFLFKLLAWRRFRKQLKQADKGYQLRQLLLNTGDFLTLEDWSEKMNLLHAGESVYCIAQKLNKLCYASSSTLLIADIKLLLFKVYTFKFWFQFNRL